MSEKKLKRKLYFWTPYQLGAFEEYLEEMAQSGWMFVKQKGVFLYFEPCRPKKVHFYIDVFNEAFMSDVRPVLNAEEYIEFCEESGWTFLQINRKIMFFYSEEENPVPIQTDQEIKLEQIFRYAKTRSIFPFCVFLFLAIVYIAESMILGGGLADFLVVTATYELVLLCMGILVFFGLDLFWFFRFYRKNKILVQAGKQIEFDSRKTVEKRGAIIAVGIAIYLLVFCMVFKLGSGSYGFAIVVALYLALVLFFTWLREGNRRLGIGSNLILSSLPVLLGLSIGIGIWSFLDNDGKTEDISYADEHGNSIHMTIYHDPIPMTLEDLDAADEEAAVYAETMREANRTLFGTYESCGEYLYDETTEVVGEGLEYSVIKSSWEMILESYVKDRLELNWTRWHDATDEEKDLWSAQQVYAGDHKDNVAYRIVRWEDRVLFFMGQDVEINEKNVKVIMETVENME
ncbi:MAG: DUF2812 domain-containing protein [Bacillota bacterium]|nr:DUF2812 domain-containing protein [Bacillota bacterium]